MWTIWSTSRSETARHSDAYWFESQRPAQVLLFLVPLLVVYETGMFMLGGNRADSLRNGADYWLRDALGSIGFDRAWLLPWLVVMTLVAWQILGIHRWKVSASTLAGMWAESLLLALSLIVAGQAQDYWLRSYLGEKDLLQIQHKSQQQPRSEAAAPTHVARRIDHAEWPAEFLHDQSQAAGWDRGDIRDWRTIDGALQPPPERDVDVLWDHSVDSTANDPAAESTRHRAVWGYGPEGMTLRAIGFVGAGIYEEFLFRFLMLPAIYLGLRLVCVPRGFAGLLAILGSSAVFCLAHYWPLDAAVTRDAASAGLASSPLVTLQSVIERIADDPRLWRGCLFRMLAGVVFAIVFVFRGFGIVVGCHALYDIVVGVLLPGLPE